MAERLRLNQAPEGSLVRVRGVEPANAARGRLCALGITPGAEIEICSQGVQCRIKVRNASLALGHDLAGCIECEAMTRAITAEILSGTPLEFGPTDCDVDFCLARSVHNDEPTMGASSAVLTQREEA